MIPNVLLSRSESDLERLFGNDFIAHIDGKKVATLREFYVEMADLLDIPDFGFTLESLNDALNDLQWLDDERIILYVTNTDQWLSKERNANKIANVLSVLDATAEDWKWLDEEDSVDRKEFFTVLEDSPRIRTLLDQEQIDYKSISEIP